MIYSETKLCVRTTNNVKCKQSYAFECCISSSFLKSSRRVEFLKISVWTLYRII